MQLSKVINFHKAVTDPTRIRIIMLLAKGPLNGLEIAERLGITPPTVTHHANKLRDAGLLYQRREKNTIFFSLDEKTLKQSSLALLKLVEQAKEGEDEMTVNTEAQLKNSVLTNFFSKDGRLKQIPSQMKKKLIVLQYIVEKLETGMKYQEKELNEFIKQFHDDFATIRREFIIHQFMYREDSVYELNPKELWTKWETLK